MVIKHTHTHKRKIYNVIFYKLDMYINSSEFDMYINFT